MAIFKRASDELIKLFMSIRSKSNIPLRATFEIVCNYEQKSICKIIKLNDSDKTLIDGIDFVVVFNEKIFLHLPEILQALVIEDCLNSVVVSQSGTTSLAIPNFDTYEKLANQFNLNSICQLYGKNQI